MKIKRKLLVKQNILKGLTLNETGCVLQWEEKAEKFFHILQDVWILATAYLVLHLIYRIVKRRHWNQQNVTK